MKNDPETYSVQCPNCAAEHCFPTRKAVAAFTKDWKSPRFESLCRKNRKLILKALDTESWYWDRSAASSRDVLIRRDYAEQAQVFRTLRAQLLEAK